MARWARHAHTVPDIFFYPPILPGADVVEGKYRGVHASRSCCRCRATVSYRERPCLPLRLDILRQSQACPPRHTAKTQRVAQKGLGTSLLALALVLWGRRQCLQEQRSLIFEVLQGSDIWDCALAVHI